MAEVHLNITSSTSPMPFTYFIRSIWRNDKDVVLKLNPKHVKDARSNKYR